MFCSNSEIIFRFYFLNLLNSVSRCFRFSEIILIKVNESRYKQRGVTIIRNRILLHQINIRQMLIAELNVKLRSLKIILIRIMIVIIITRRRRRRRITIIIIIIIIIHLTMRITQDKSITQEIQCLYLGIALSKT